VLVFQVSFCFLLVFLEILQQNHLLSKALNLVVVQLILRQKDTLCLISPKL